VKGALLRVARACDWSFMVPAAAAAAAVELSFTKELVTV
jgi:hypothetical protein